MGESRLDNLAHDLWLVDHWTPRSRRFFQSLQSLLVEAVEPSAHHALTDLETLGNLGRTQSLVCQPHKLGSFQLPGWHLSRMQQLLECGVFFLGEFSQSQSHVPSPLLSLEIPFYIIPYLADAPLSTPPQKKYSELRAIFRLFSLSQEENP